jgi:hypothetical protein
MSRSLILFFCSLPFFALANHDFEGIWVNHQLQSKIEIRVLSNHLEVFGADDYHVRNGHFRRVSSRKYVDQYGNSLVLENRNIVRLKLRRSNRKVYFEKVIPVYRGNQNDDYRERIVSNRLEGTWYAPQVNKELVIVEERYGFKVKFIGDTKDWIYFEKLNDKVYKDNRGNTYTVGNGKMIWSSYDRAKIFEIQKRTDRIDW